MGIFSHSRGFCFYCSCVSRTAAELTGMAKAEHDDDANPLGLALIVALIITIVLVAMFSYSRLAQ
jgi:hypothetical protein